MSRKATLIVAIVATCLLAIGLIKRGERQLGTYDTKTFTDGDRLGFKVSGEVILPRAGTVYFFGYKATALTYRAPFDITINRSRLSDRDLLPLALDAARLDEGRWTINWVAIILGWLACFLACWLTWLIIDHFLKRRRAESAATK